MTIKNSILSLLIILSLTKTFGQTTDNYNYKAIILDANGREIESHAKITLFDTLGNTYLSDSNIVPNLKPNRSYLVQIQLIGFFSIEKNVFLRSNHYFDTVWMTPINTIKSLRIFVDSSTINGFDEKVLIDYFSSNDCNSIQIYIDDSYLIDSICSNLVKTITRIFFSLHHSNYSNINIVFRENTNCFGVIEIKCDTLNRN